MVEQKPTVVLVVSSGGNGIMLCLIQGGESSKYVCHLCNNKFVKGNLLTKHLRFKHHYSLPPGHKRFRSVFCLLWIILFLCFLLFFFLSQVCEGLKCNTDSAVHKFIYLCINIKSYTKYRKEKSYAVQEKSNAALMSQLLKWHPDTSDTPFLTINNSKVAIAHL